MSNWVPALSMAVFVATVPLLWVFRILTDLPHPLVLSHRQWPAWANFCLIGLITANVTVFIHGMYDGGTEEPLSFLLRCVIAGVIYLFGFVFLVRQFAGLYPEYFVTAGRTGFGIRKALYRNIVDIGEASASRHETHLRIHMKTGESLHLILPTRELPAFHKAIEDNQPEP
jgi:hypothetical protein